MTNWTSARKFADSCGARIPAWVDEAYRAAQRDGRTELLSTALCTELCSTLVDEGVDALHFYTLNRPDLTRNVCRALGVTTQNSIANVA